MSDSAQSSQSSLIFGFLVAFLGIFAIGVSGGIVWPSLRRALRRIFPWLPLGIDEDDDGGFGGGARGRDGEVEVPKLWDVVVQEVGEEGGKGKKTEIGRMEGASSPEPGSSNNPIGPCSDSCHHHWAQVGISRSAWERLHASILSNTVFPWPRIIVARPS